MDELLIGSMSRFDTADVTIGDSNIIVNKKDSINDVISTIVQHSVITDVNIIDDSLERFFEA